MRVLCSSLMVLLHLHLSVLFDASYAGSTNITATESGNVTLQLEEQGQKQDVTWVTTAGNHFATTKPGEKISIRDPQYFGRLRGLNDGSLFITQLTLKDQGTYRAKIRLANGSASGQNFNLIVTEYTSPGGAASVYGSWHALPFIPSLWLLVNSEVCNIVG